MRVRVVVLGHRMPDWIESGWNEFARRIPREWDLSLVELKPEPRARGKPVATLLSLEAGRIRSACRGARMIALDERGTPWSTRALADHLARWRDDAEDAAFVIGSADGLDPGLRRDAAACVSLSALTLPHALVRVILVEQVYRASALLAGHPYHRD